MTSAIFVRDALKSLAIVVAKPEVGTERRKGQDGGFRSRRDPPDLTDYVADGLDDRLNLVAGREIVDANNQDHSFCIDPAVVEAREAPKNMLGAVA